MGTPRVLPHPCLGLHVWVLSTLGLPLKMCDAPNMPQHPPNWPLQSLACEEDEAGHWWTPGSWGSGMGHARLLQPTVGIGDPRGRSWGVAPQGSEHTVGPYVRSHRNSLSVRGLGPLVLLQEPPGPGVGMPRLPLGVVGVRGQLFRVCSEYRNDTVWLTAPCALGKLLSLPEPQFSTCKMGRTPPSRWL